MTGAAEDFDLGAALAAGSKTPDEERDKCPDCGCMTVYPKQPGTAQGSNFRMDGDYRCGKCGAHFGEEELE